MDVYINPASDCRNGFPWVWIVYALTREDRNGLVRVFSKAE